MTEEQTNNKARFQSESNMDNTIIQEAISGRPTEVNNNDSRYTQVDNDVIYNPIEGYNQNSEINNNENQNNPESGENINQNFNINQNNPLYNVKKQTYNLK